MNENKKKEYSESQEAILDAALVEFSERGLDGARIESIAQRSGYNKALVYRYFKSKEELFKAALERKFIDRGELFKKQPKELFEIISYWFQQSFKDKDIPRLYMHEAMNDDKKEPMAGPLRRQNYKDHVEHMKTQQKEGVLNPDFDTEMLFIVFLALTSFPASFPQLIRLSCDLEPESRKFKKRWEDTLVKILTAIKS